MDMRDTLYCNRHLVMTITRRSYGHWFKQELPCLMSDFMAKTGRLEPRAEPVH